MTSRIRGSAGLLAILVTLTGCGSNDANLAPVHGKVEIDGVPMTWGRVQFAPVATADNKFPGKPAYGWIQPDGTFVLSTNRTDDGAVVGKHRVTIYRRKPATSEDEDPSAPAAVAMTGPDLKFDTLRLVGLYFDVQPGVKNDIPIEVTSDFVRQFGEQRD